MKPQKKGPGPACRPDDLLIVDPAGAWLAGWKANFAFFEIPVLRSHMLAHPDPRTELALVEAEEAVGKVAGNDHTGIDVLSWNKRLMKGSGAGGGKFL